MMNSSPVIIIDDAAKSIEILEDGEAVEVPQNDEHTAKIDETNETNTTQTVDADTKEDSSQQPMSMEATSTWITPPAFDVDEKMQTFVLIHGGDSVTLLEGDPRMQKSSSEFYDAEMAESTSPKEPVDTEEPWDDQFTRLFFLDGPAVIEEAPSPSPMTETPPMLVAPAVTLPPPTASNTPMPYYSAPPPYQQQAYGAPSLSDDESYCICIRDTPAWHKKADIAYRLADCAVDGIQLQMLHNGRVDAYVMLRSQYDLHVALAHSGERWGPREPPLFVEQCSISDFTRACSASAPPPPSSRSDARSPSPRRRRSPPRRASPSLTSDDRDVHLTDTSGFFPAPSDEVRVSKTALRRQEGMRRLREVIDEMEVGEVCDSEKLMQEAIKRAEPGLKFSHTSFKKNSFYTFVESLDNVSVAHLTTRDSRAGRTEYHFDVQKLDSKNDRGERATNEDERHGEKRSYVDRGEQAVRSAKRAKRTFSAYDEESVAATLAKLIQNSGKIKSSTLGVLINKQFGRKWKDLNLGRLLPFIENHAIGIVTELMPGSHFIEPPPIN